LNPREVFSDADLEAIGAAAAEVERRSAAEVVPYIVGRCHDYPEAAWAAAALGAVAAAALAAVAELFVGPWGASGPLWIGLPPLLGAVAGHVLVRRSPGLARRLTSPEAMARHARLRAEAAFLEEKVFQTRERSGVLVLLALHERQAVILADEGVNATVPPDTWLAIVRDLVAGVTAGRPTEAMVQAIQACAGQLAPLSRRPDDRDELSDEVRLRDR
jgi:putative membrane protein